MPKSVSIAKPWPKLSQNRSSTCDAELITQGNPQHAVCAWIGNSESVAKKHHLQVIDEHFAKVADLIHTVGLDPPTTTVNVMRQKTRAADIQGNLLTLAVEANAKNLGEFNIPRGFALVWMGDEGLEPPTYAV